MLFNRGAAPRLIHAAQQLLSNIYRDIVAIDVLTQQRLKNNITNKSTNHMGSLGRALGGGGWGGGPPPPREG